MEELQWARILVKLNGEELSNMVKIWEEEVCYVLTLWWEVRLLIRFYPAGLCGKEVGAGEEVGGKGSICAGKRVVEEDEGCRLEALFQFADGTRGQTSGSGRPLVPSRSFDRSSGRPSGGLQLLGGPSKSGPGVEYFIPSVGPVGLGIVLSASKEARPFGLESQPLFGKSGPIGRGSLQPSHEARAQVGGLPFSVLPGPSSLGCPVSEPFKF